MAKKFKAEVLDAVVDGKRKGESVELDKKSAKHLERIGYIRVTGEVKPKQAPKPKAKPKDKKVDTKDIKGTNKEAISKSSEKSSENSKEVKEKSGKKLSKDK